MWFEFVTLKAPCKFMEAAFSREELNWKVSPLSDLDIIKSACPESFHLESFYRTHAGLPLQPRGYCIFLGGRRSWWAGHLNPCCSWLIFPGRWGWMGLILQVFFFSMDLHLQCAFLWSLVEVFRAPHLPWDKHIVDRACCPGGWKSRAWVIWHHKRLPAPSFGVRVCQTCGKWMRRCMWFLPWGGLGKRGWGCRNFLCRWCTGSSWTQMTQPLRLWHEELP